MNIFRSSMPAIRMTLYSSMLVFSRMSILFHRRNTHNSDRAM